MAIEYLENGKKVSEIPTQVVGVDYCTVNKKAMDALGITKDAIKTSVEIKVVE